MTLLSRAFNRDAKRAIIKGMNPRGRLKRRLGRSRGTTQPSTVAVIRDGSAIMSIGEPHAVIIEEFFQCIFLS